MGSFKTILILILFISFMVFVAFFGRLPALRLVLQVSRILQRLTWMDRRTPIAALHRLIWVHIPKAVLATDQLLTGGRVSSYLWRFGNYMLHERHWTVVIFFLLILVVSEFMYLPQVWHKIGLFTKFTAAIAVFLPYMYLYLACSADPGYITPDNHAYHLSLYPYDHTLFHPGHVCRTCRLLKPARSKHCSICKKCVAKADHHCIFINSCVGYGNQHYFVLLLLSTSLLCTYGGILGLSIISERVRRWSPEWSLWKPSNMTWTRYLAGWGWGIQDNVNMGASTLLAILTAPLVWGLLIYTVYLIYCGTTTNETLKWSEWKEDMHDGFAFRRTMSAGREKNMQVEPRYTRWPLETEQILITTRDGQPPKDDAPIPGEGPWERVWGLSHVENLYDMGFWDNLMDVFVVDYAFGQRTDELGVERRRLLQRLQRVGLLSLLALLVGGLVLILVGINAFIDLRKDGQLGYTPPGNKLPFRHGSNWSIQTWIAVIGAAFGLLSFGFSETYIHVFDSWSSRQSKQASGLDYGRYLNTQPRAPVSYGIRGFPYFATLRYFLIAMGIFASIAYKFVIVKPDVFIRPQPGLPS
ncbi:hypothetical protein NM208_g10280 [Fusarium decemcellulare]|uniref:Uncharacterized protein n=1 Tax=Fusarium decemcellulare TaxID=57161 RepID=A0ACC1RYM1_9HYPO|nr:hypothetical protein NM208_g10280 [Fusarium decemcellulare]